MKTKKFISLFIAALLVIITAFSLQSCTKIVIPENTEESSSEEESQTSAPAPLTDPLTGHSDYDRKYENSKPVGIVVENHPQARPQWGFTSPDIVMEYEVEGGISRMLWLYSNVDEVPDKVGPVRSARHDVVELALGMDMLFVHCGGSDIALNLIKEYSSTLAEIEGLTYEKCFYRDTTRSVSKEHTLVLRGSDFRQSVDDLGLETEIDPAYKSPFSFENENSPRTLGGNECASVHFEFSNSYKYDFTFNESTNKYTSKINGTLCTDENGTECAYTNVIVLYVDMVDLHDASGHQDLVLENGGRGLYISGGRSEEIVWQKSAKTEKLQLFSADGSSPLTLNAGNSYIGLVRSTQQGKTRF